ncbi:MAG: cell division protein FtsQ/DivIB [Prevotellaceae bacterium]|jgi:cell division protein FtsQ|nr:cell division protein FtsQ/DivIB [Prevotellaceae bacterium]
MFKLKKILPAFFAVLVLAYMCTVLAFTAGNGKETVCNQLNITMVDSAKIRLISSREIARILAGNNLNPVGKTYKHIETESIENLLRRNPVIKDVECYKTPAGVLQLRVVQRSPKFRVMTEGENYYVDTERFIMPVSTSYAAYIPVVSGQVTKTRAAGDLFDFITFLEKNPFWNAQIEQIYITYDRNIELVPRIGDSLIRLGSLDNYKVKLNKLEKLYAEVFCEIGWNRYKTIDLRYKNQVVCTRK